MNNVKKILIENYEQYLQEYIEKIENNILIIKNEKEQDFVKENSIRELEQFFGKEIGKMRPTFGTATKFWIDFIMSPTRNIDTLKIEQINQLTKYKTVLVEEKFKEKEEVFDSLDRKIHKALKEIGKQLPSISSIKRKPGYYGNIIGSKAK